MTASEDVSSRWSEILTPQYAPATLIISLGVALLALNSFVATVSLPTAVDELGGVALISWAVTLYLVLAIVGGSGAALLKQKLGARRALLGSAGLFLVGTLVVGGAGAMPQVLVGRALQGLGEGMVAAICFALIPALFPARLVPKVFGLQAMMWAIAAFGGPAVAGLLTEMLSWRAAFLFSVPLVLIFGAMVLIAVPAQIADEQVVQFPGVRLLAIGVGILLVALAAVAPPLIAVGLLVLSAAILIGAVWLDGRSRDRLMPPDAFRLNTVVGTGLWMSLLMNIAAAGSAVYLVLVVQQAWNFGPTTAGAVAAVLAVAWSASAIVVANVRKRATRKLLIRTGPAMIAGGLLLVLTGLQMGQVAVALAGQLLIGAGFGTCNGYLNLSMMEAASDAERDRTSALVPTTQSAGGAIGAALAGVAANGAGLASATAPHDVIAAMVPLYALGFVVAAMALAAAWHMVGLMQQAEGQDATVAA